MQETQVVRGIGYECVPPCNSSPPTTYISMPYYLVNSLVFFTIDCESLLRTTFIYITNLTEDHILKPIVITNRIEPWLLVKRSAFHPCQRCHYLFTQGPTCYFFRVWVKRGREGRLDSQKRVLSSFCQKKASK